MDKLIRVVAFILASFGIGILLTACLTSEQHLGFIGISLMLLGSLTAVLFEK